MHEFPSELLGAAAAPEESGGAISGNQFPSIDDAALQAASRISPEDITSDKALAVLKTLKATSPDQLRADMTADGIPDDDQGPVVKLLGEMDFSQPVNQAADPGKAAKLARDLLQKEWNDANRYLQEAKDDLEKKPGDQGLEEKVKRWQDRVDRLPNPEGAPETSGEKTGQPEPTKFTRDGIERLVDVLGKYAPGATVAVLLILGVLALRKMSEGWGPNKPAGA